MNTEECSGDSAGNSGKKNKLGQLNVWVPRSMERILPIGSDCLKSTCKLLPENVNSTSSLVLEGNASTHRTALLFQAAVSHTIEGAHVAYVCPTSFTSLPPGVHGMNQPNPASAQRLKMMYLPMGTDLVDFLATIHQQPALPEVLIIDDLHVYISQSEDDGLERSAACLFAHIADALNVMKSKSEDKEVFLIIGINNLSAAITDILPQFFQAVYSLQERGIPEEFHMVPVSSTRHQVSGLVSRRNPLAGFVYNYTMDTICLKHIHQDEAPRLGGLV